MSLNRNPYLIAICTFNEADNIEILITYLLGSYRRECDILIIDDHSPDGTADIVQRISQENPEVSLMLRDGPKGRGNASKAGYQYFMDHENYEYLIELDGDLSHDYRDIRRLIDQRDKALLVIGSRHSKGASFGNYPIHRIWMSKLANFFVRFILNLRVNDATNSFLCISRQVFEVIPPDTLKSENFSLFMELKYLCEIKKLDIFEIPITIKDREHGDTKMSFLQVLNLFKITLDLKRRLK